MLAISIASVVIVLTITLMNKGLALIQNSIERSQERTYIQGQIAALRYLRDMSMSLDGSAEWQKIITNAPTGYLSSGSPAALADDTTCKPDTTTARPFYIDIQDGTPTGSVVVVDYDSNVAAPQTIATPGRWLWVEAYKVSQTSSQVTAVDLTIRSCWYPISGGVIQHETTTVRLYDGV